MNQIEQILHNQILHNQVVIMKALQYIIQRGYGHEYFGGVMLEQLSDGILRSEREGG